MGTLTLKHGPFLERRSWRYDRETAKGEWVSEAATTRAHEFLFDTVELAEDVTLADIFSIFDRSPALRDVFRRDFCDELLVEARKGVSPDFKLGYATDGIEYLELHQGWYLNSTTRTYQAMHRLDFHGVGYALREPLDEGHGITHPAGHRIQWSVSCTPLRQLLTLPLRVKREVAVFEDDIDAKAWGQALPSAHVEGVSLGQVLHGVLWELSFHGGPVETEAFRESLNQQMAEVHAGTAELTSVDDTEWLTDLPSLMQVFDSLGSVKGGVVRQALRELDDDVPAAGALSASLGAEVVVKPAFAHLGAKALRRLLREVESESRAPALATAQGAASAPVDGAGSQDGCDLHLAGATDVDGNSADEPGADGHSANGHSAGEHQALPGAPS